MRRILGVNFGAEVLDAEIADTARFGTVKTVKSEKVTLPAGREERAAVIAETLNRWKKEYSLQAAVVGIPLQRFSCQIIDMPAMKKNDLKKALLFELEKYLPLPVDEYFFDFIAQPGEKGMSKVLVFSVKKDLAGEITDIMRAAGIEVLSIRCSAMTALCSLFEMTGGKKVSGLFVHSVDGAYEIAGIRNSIPVFLKGFPKNIDLVRELERLTVLYPGGVYFVGNIDGRTAEKFKGGKYQAPVPGALLRHMGKKTCLDLDFLPQDLVKKERDLYPYLAGGLAAAALTLFFLTGTVAYYKEWNLLRAIEARRSAVKTRAAAVFESRKKLNTLEGDRKVLRNFRGRSNAAVRVLRDLSEALPKDAWLISLSIDDKGKVEIEGFTKRTASVIAALEKSNVFRNVAFSAPIISREGEERFALKMEVEGL